MPIGRGLPLRPGRSDSAACLRSPLYATRFHEGFGTLYTAEYRPIDGVARYHWPHRTWEHSLDKVLPESIQLRLGIP